MLKAAPVFGDHMVLQREKPVCIWGTARPGVQICVRLSDGVPVCAQADEKGHWRTQLPPRPAARDLTLTISDDETSLVFSDLCIGEVWIAGGQSNMEFYLDYDAEKQASYEEAGLPELRIWDCPKLSCPEQATFHEYSRFGRWRPCTREDMPYFPAVAWYFARRLRKELDVPVGIVCASWGGTPACAWMDPEALRGTRGEVWLTKGPELSEAERTAALTAYCRNPVNDKSNPFAQDRMTLYTRRLMDPGLSRPEQEKMLELMQKYQRKNPSAPNPFAEQRPGGLYHSMLEQIIPYTARGIIFYQGESDDRHPEVYDTVLEKLIGCWRARWGEPLPFLFVQIAPMQAWMDSVGDQLPEVRRRQAMVARRVPAVWMASSSDAGEQWDIHPKHKRPIGERLALLALGHVYGHDILCDAPRLQNAVLAESRAVFTFQNGEGLHLKGAVPEALVLTDEAGCPLPVERVLTEENRLVVQGKFPPLVHAAFACTPWYTVTLYNRAGLPAHPFEVQLKRGGK